MAILRKHVFVIESTDIDKLGTALEELQAMLISGEELRDAVLLVFGNKQD